MSLSRSGGLAKELGYHSIATAALLSWEWLQREKQVFGAFEITHYRPKQRPNSVRIVYPKNREEAWWPLFDETGEPLFPELMLELDATGLAFRAIIHIAGRLFCFLGSPNARTCVTSGTSSKR